MGKTLVTKILFLYCEQTPCLDGVESVGPECSGVQLRGPDRRDVEPGWSSSVTQADHTVVTVRHGIRNFPHFSLFYIDRLTKKLVPNSIIDTEVLRQGC